MNAAMLLAALAGCGWAINIVVVRWALGRTGAPSLVAASVGVTFAALVAASIAVAAGEPLPEIGDLWRFWLVGVVAPGGSQGMFVAAIGLIGSSRASVLIGTSPAWSVALAVIFLGEPLQALGGGRRGDQLGARWCREAAWCRAGLGNSAELRDP
jgi:drug/metabolite transporter (DMT)-like permease